ncbi:MAG: hypothetical protein B7Z66_04510 [Chromatiales bacterium 21-64-14]|nr:MAG: hypothetical protein B7Z66_04510 [Chromatiales bacterium 21-64-14]HQU14592.1 mechanosensitive ion channel [Gammaproteobacteria bacterium]
MHKPIPRATGWSWFGAGGCFGLLLAFFALGGAALAQGAPYNTSALDHLQRELRVVQRSLDRRVLSGQELRTLLDHATQVQTTANQCVADAAKQADQIQKDLDTLGPPTPGEAPAVGHRRSGLEQEKIDTEQGGATCRLLLLDSQEVLTEIGRRQKQRLAQHLLTRGPSIIALIRENWAQPTAWWSSTRAFLRAHSGFALLALSDWLELAATLLAAAIAAWFARRWLLPRAAREPAPASFGARFNCALLSVSARYATRLLVTGAAAAFLWAELGDVEPDPFIAVLAYGAFFYVALLAGIRLFLAPCPPAPPYLPLAPDLAHALARRLRVLVGLLVVGLLVFTTVLSRSLPLPALELARAIYAAVLVLNVVWIIWLLGQLPRFAHTVVPRVLVTLVLGAALGAEWLGYRNLSVLMLRGLLGTGLALGFTLLAQRLLFDALDGFDHGRHGWQRRVRGLMDLKHDELVPGLGWLRVLMGLALWFGFAATVLRIWTLSDAGFLAVIGLVNTAVPIGSLRIVPARVLMAAVVFALLLGTSRWLRRRLSRQWLQSARMERGAREAMVTMTGYLTVAIGLLAALSIAGVNLTSLAIVAGALSVGIGFGLQNIVNNFVSGIILLFERPIKTGDWIVVGEVEGHVKRISIRSTIIQTFDWADVIVPNSDLISGKVTNWMLRDPWGRIRVPIGVAYGSDTALVKQLLLEVASAHPHVLSGGAVPDPIVLFLAFGDSSLNFELRCFIRDIDRRLAVISDINFSIDEEFRKHGVEIPFPQRDLHVRDWTPPPDAGRRADTPRDPGPG